MSWFPKELYWIISCSYILTPTIKTEVERGFGVNMAFRRDVLEKVGLFDTTFGIVGNKWVGGDDTEMFLRVKKTGMKVIFDPSMKVLHKIYLDRIRFKNLAKRAFSGGFSVALMKRKIKYNPSNSIEKNYLNHILFKFYPRAILKFLRALSIVYLKQILAVSIVVLAEFIGYMYGLSVRDLG
mgnify:CR=1 FL=1